MTRAWETLATVETDEGPLELRQRADDDFLICVGGRVLMSSRAHRSESALAKIACGTVVAPQPRVLIGGLGMAFTLRAALDALPADAVVVVAELHPCVVQWCEGPLAPLCGHALADPRVRVELGDVARAIEAAAHENRRFDAVILDLYEGPHARTDPAGDPFYGARAIDRTRRALRSGGVFAVWGEDRDAGFEDRLKAAGFTVETQRPGTGGRRHAVTLARQRPPSLEKAPVARQR